MTSTEFLRSLHRRGIDLVPLGDGHLRYRPRGALSSQERAALARHRSEILVLLDADPIGWRVAVMAGQVPPTGRILLLMARPGIAFPMGTCCSCGDARPSGRARCDSCGEAAVRVLARSSSTGALA